MLQPSEVHIWHANLVSETSSGQNYPSRAIDSFLPLLSADEQQKADRFRFDKDRHKFMIARGLLRTILSQYLESPPDQIEFSYSAKGKPSLAADCSLFFNVSHSHQMALYGIARHPIGIDLEHLRPIDAVPLAQRFFSPQEATIIQSLTKSEQHRAFFRGWTQKEAYLKATGDGLVGLESVEVALDEPMKILKINGDSETAARWFVAEIIVPDYVAAIAGKGTTPTLSHFSI
jgi:4'-phosphopantetheinyl transferase